MPSNGNRKPPADILLISCYELGHQPFNLASPLAALAHAGYPARAVDLAVEPLLPEAVTPARFVGVSVPMHTALRMGEAAARQVRAVSPEAHICFYGHYAGLNADYLLEEVADSVVAGEYEPVLVGLAAALANGGYYADQPPAGVRTRQAHAAPFIARIPFTQPQRESLPPLEKYAHFVHNGRPELVGYVEASRGCKHTCLHCPITPIYNGRFFVVPSEVVLADIRAQAAQGARHITFGDPDFLNGPGHPLRILRAMHAEFPHLTFDFTARIEHLLKHARLLPELADLGCAFVVSAVESLSDEVLRALDKGHTRADVERALELLDAADIPMRPSLVAFTPWTTLPDYAEVLDFVRKRDLIDHVDAVQYSIRLLIPPGSALLETNKDAPWLGPLDRENYTYTWTHPDPRMDRLCSDVAARVAQAERSGEDPRHTFAAVEALAYAALGVQPPTPHIVPRARPIPPRLTESWFC